jgi:hypothetical protein
LRLASQAPHGGFKPSGFGKDLSSAAVGDCQVTRHVMIARQTDPHSNNSLGCMAGACVFVRADRRRFCFILEQ